LNFQGGPVVLAIKIIFQKFAMVALGVGKAIVAMGRVNSPGLGRSMLEE